MEPVRKGLPMNSRRAGFVTRHRASLIASALGLLWCVLVVSRVQSGLPPDPVLFPLVRAALLMLAAFLLLQHAVLGAPSGRHRRSWLWIGAAITAVGLGESYRTALTWQIGEHFEVGMADAFYLSYFPLMLAGLLQLPRGFSGRNELAKFLLDCATVSIGGGMFVWQFAIHPAWQIDRAGDSLLTFIAIAYPVGDLLTLVGIAAVMLRLPTGPMRSVYLLLGATLCTSLVGDLVWILAQLFQWHSGIFAELLWLAQAVLLVWFAESARLTAPDDLASAASLGSRFAILPYLALAAGYGLIAVIAIDSGSARSEALPGLLALGGVLLACVMLRQALANQDYVRLLGEQTRRSGESRLAKLIENATDGIFVLDADLRVRYASPSVVRLLALPAARLVDARIDDFLSRDDADSLQSLLTTLDAERGRRSGKLMLRFRSERGEWLWTEATLSDQRNDATLSGIVLNVRDMSEHQQMEAQMQHLALHDALTQLPNRELFLSRVERAIAPLDGQVPSIAVAVLDLEQLRLINDSLGHDTGDQVVVLAAERVRNALRSGDTVARIGADEFALLLEDADDASNLGARIERVLASFHEPFRVGAHSLRVSAGIGVALARAGADAGTLLRDADTTAASARQEGPNRHRVFAPELHARALERLALQAAVPEALDQDRFVIHLQPVLGLVDGYPVALRPRMRWRNPATASFPIERLRGNVQGEEVAFRLGEWILATAQREYASLLRYQPAAGALSLLIPIDSRHLHHAGWVARISALLEEIGMPAVNLMVAVSEEALGGDSEAALKPLRELRAIGVRLALARFGSRASSLAVLHEPLFDALILSRSLSQGLSQGGRGQTLVRGVVGLADALNARAIATGVDTPEIRDALADAGCLYGIGTALAQPMPLEHLLPWLGGRLAESGA